jgi:hypothetical protein
MLNSLLLIIVMVSSLFLAFYCVDFHKDNIATLVKKEKKSMAPILVEVEKNLTKEKVKVVEPAESVDAIEKVYVEVLAVDDKNETSKIVEKIESKSETVVEENTPVVIEKVEVIKEVKSIKKEKVNDKKTIDEPIASEYSEGYKLDDLEKMIMEELKKGNKD